MNTTGSTITIIEKEIIDLIDFPKQEVLLDTEQIKRRNYEAHKAMKLGNSFKDKVKIIFEDIQGVKMVETTVWGVTDSHLMLKRGIMLPLGRIHEILI